MQTLDIFFYRVNQLCLVLLDGTSNLVEQDEIRISS